MILYEINASFSEIGWRPCDIAYAQCRGNRRRIAGSCSVLLDQTDCDQAVRSTWLGHSAPVRPNKRRRVLYRASPLVATPRGHFFFYVIERPECRPDSILSPNVLAQLLNFIFLALLLSIRWYDRATIG